MPLTDDGCFLSFFYFFFLPSQNQIDGLDWIYLSNGGNSRFGTYRVHGTIEVSSLERENCFDKQKSSALPQNPSLHFLFEFHLSRQGMDCVSPILDVVTRVWNCTAKHAGYIQDLQENMNSLRNAMQELKNVHEDVKGRVDLEEQRQMRRTNEVDVWLHSVQQVMEIEVNEILQKTTSFLWSSYNFLFSCTKFHNCKLV